MAAAGLAREAVEPVTGLPRGICVRESSVSSGVWVKCSHFRILVLAFLRPRPHNTGVPTTNTPKGTDIMEDIAAVTARDGGAMGWRAAYRARAAAAARGAMGGLTFKPGDVVTWRTSAGRTCTAPVLDTCPRGSNDYAQTYGVLVGFTLGGDGAIDPEEGVVRRSEWERVGTRPRKSVSG